MDSHFWQCVSQNKSYRNIYTEHVSRRSWLSRHSSKLTNALFDKVLLHPFNKCQETELSFRGWKVLLFLRVTSQRMW